MIICVSNICMANAEDPRFVEEYNLGTKENLSWFGQNVTLLTNLFTYNVTMSMETESDGDWLIDNSYEIRWKISLVYVNSEVFTDPSDFYFTLFNPHIIKYAYTEPIINRTDARIGQEGLLTANCTPNRLINQTDITSFFDGNYTFNGQAYPCGWEMSPNILINITSSAMPSFTPPSDRNASHLELIDYLIPISVFLSVFIILLVLLYRRRPKTTIGK
jgi:hypothetical protein